jgi:glycosyltransferase involved in cell wall biosynthesis
MLRTIDEKQGIGVYTKNVMDHLLELDDRNEYVLFYASQEPAGRYSGRRNATEVAVPGRNKAVWDQLRVPLEARRRGVDVLFHTKFTVPLVGGPPSVMVLHGSEWYVYPKSYHLADRIYIRMLMPLYCRKAARIISVSEMTKRDLVRFVGVSEDKIETIYSGLDRRFEPIADPVVLAATRANYALPEQFILFVGRIYPGKNFPALLEAFATVARGAPHRLVVAGYAAPGYDEPFAAVARLGLGDRVQFLGWVPQSDLAGLYNLADLFVYPSFYEAFGIPLLEAMACGCPIVASGTGAVPEIAGEAVYRIDPHDPTSIARGIQAVLSDPGLRRRMVARGREQVRAYDWTECARRTLAVLESAGSANGSAPAGLASGRTDPREGLEKRCREG